MTHPTSNTEVEFARIVQALRRTPKVTLGGSKKGFGSAALCVGGRIFAMVTSKGTFVVKLPKARVDGVVASGAGQRFDPGHGRVMKEWLVVESAPAGWLPLAREALAFVGAKK